jgi:DNA end-binding protein Ku
MPRPSWNGHLRLSLVSCPISLAPATSEAERISLHQINPETGNRVKQRLVDAETGEEVERSGLIRGYEVEKGHYITLTPDELSAIKIESTRILDLTRFVSRSSVDPLYIDAPYFIYPEKSGEEAYRVIAQAMANKKRVALGRIVLSTREHPVMVEPFLDGLLMTTLRAANEVRSAEFNFKDRKLTGEMVEMAETIMDRLVGKWEPASFHDEYQDALRALIEQKRGGRPIGKGAPPVEEPSNVVDLMSVLKRSLSANREKTAPAPAPARPARAKARGKQDARQGSMLLPISSKQEPRAKPAKAAGAKARQRRKA